MRACGFVSSLAWIGVATATALAGGDSGWWSLRPLREVKPPELEGKPGDWPRNAIDALVLERLDEVRLEPSPPADPRTVVRRLFYDLIGLPPSPEEVADFAADPSDEAYEHLVARLLASPRHGERWARHWLDVARYGESNGFEYNEPRKHAWPYRDWVIEALNEDLPYDEFVRMQLAGDVLDPGVRGVAAVGFLVAGVHNSVLGSSDVMKRQARQEELEEIVGAVGQAFLGMTVHCARCHDHKVDPIPTEDYYRVAAALAGVMHGEREIRGASGEGEKKLRVYTVVSRDPGTMYIHVRGSAADLGREVKPGVLTAVRGIDADLGLSANSSDAERRRGLAGWTTDAGNPLFARVAVNRIWHHHFGVGIVETPNDLGRNGGRPSHPELLDWLAGWFQRNGYRLKALHRLIVTSATYRQASTSRPLGRSRDTDNRFLWRFSPRRVEAEVLRDSILEVAGALDTHEGGPGYEDVTEHHFNAGRYYRPIEAGDRFTRRTIYRFSPRGGRSALLDTFDCPDPSTTAPRRAVTTTPLQALTLLHNSFVWRLAERFAGRVESAADDTTTDQVRRAWQLALCRTPDATEEELSVRLVERHGLAALSRALFNSSEFVLID